MRTSPQGPSRRLLLAGGLGVAGVSLFSLTGCQSAVDAGAGDAAAGPVRGGVLNLAANADAQPAFVLANRAGNWLWRRLVFEPLAEIDASGTPQPVLAKSWAFDEARTKVTIELRDDAKFHSGRALTAADVKFSLEQAAIPANASQLAAVAQKITRIEADGDHRVVLTLDRPTDSLFDLFHLTMIVDSETFAGLADGAKVVGTGPFVWKEWKPGASLSLERNPSYRVPERPYLDGVTVSVITDPTALQSALRGGRVQLAAGIGTKDAGLLTKDDKFSLENAGGVFYPLGLDVTAAPFDKKEARQAVAYAIDRERIKDQVFGGDATVTDLWWSPGQDGYPQDLATKYSYDPAKARELVEKAGVKGAKVPITLANLPIPQSIFEIVQNNLREAGFEPVAEVLDTAQFDARQVEGKLGPAFLLLHGMVGFSAATILDAMPSLRAGNPSKFTTDEYDDLRTAVQEATDDTRATALSGLSDYMLDEAFSNVTVVANQYHVKARALAGVQVVALGSVVATDAYLTK
ncbi:peptide/nickel transport system substrate-binding protein [Actinocorallia herbida]|uniref:Peptide/nickel transport system substrate-binding protein n=1 Tax=Actinocorallia herbida TaxID=58109 RepID=A0A3N1CV05_9ACTN|nr:ABC transporter substrate-binding protein [Actinocorallia herbida]ROO85122.1 peptide/nickel transport system substrate-binding protein [Actinocorallia herbida]